MSDLNAKNPDNELNAKDQLDASRDMLAEELLNNINTTPLGKLLKKISTMPEIRREKVANVRRRLNRGEYDLNQNLDLALDKVIEELIS